MHDCHELARCVNLFGGYACQVRDIDWEPILLFNLYHPYLCLFQCREGYGDRYAEDEDRSGRFCESCSKDFCHGRGECKVPVRIFGCCISNL